MIIVAGIIAYLAIGIIGTVILFKDDPITYRHTVLYAIGTISWPLWLSLSLLALIVAVIIRLINLKKGE